MRTFDEIYTDIAQAVSISDFFAVAALAQEMDLLGTPESEAAAANAWAVVTSHDGRYRESLAHYDRALEAYQALGDRDGIARVVGGLAIVYSELGDTQKALETYHRALEIHIEEGDPINTAVVTGNIGTIHLHNSDYPQALEHFQKSLDLYEEHDGLIGQAYALGNIGTLYLHTGDYAKAMEYFLRALAVHEQTGDQNGIASITADIGRIYAFTGDLALARDHYDRALSIYERINDPASAAFMQLLIGDHYVTVNELSQALQYLRQALASFNRLERQYDVQRTLSDLINALLRSGEIDEARQHLDTLASAGLDNPRLQAEYHANRATLLEMSGAPDDAREYLLKALAIATERGLRQMELTYHLRLRDLAQQRNDFAGYITHNTEHTRLSEELRGKQVTQKLAVIDAERKIESERRERDKERALLYGALPKTVVERLLRGEQVTGDHFDDAAVLFIDVVSFTDHTTGMHPADVVTLLENMFRTFDEICDRHGVMKVKTIGDSYMCFRANGALHENASSVASAACDVFSTTFMWPDGDPVRYRAGAHVGPATAGVIGTQRLQYDVWGDTVNVASRMESHGEPGRIHVSEAFAEALQGETAKGRKGEAEFEVIPRGTIDIKGKGAMTTFWLVPSASTDRS